MQHLTTCKLILSDFQWMCLTWKHLRFSFILWWKNLIKLSIQCLFMSMLPLGGSVASLSLLTVKLSFVAWLQDGLTKVSLFGYIHSRSQFSQCNPWVWGQRRWRARSGAQQHSVQGLQQQTQRGPEGPVHQCRRALLGPLCGCTGEFKPPLSLSPFGNSVISITPLSVPGQDS